MKNFLIVANWKLNGNIKMISSFFETLKLNLSAYANKSTIVFAPSDVYLERVYQCINDMNIFLAAQNVDINLKGAFTGESSILMLKDIGVKYIIIGHSERRLFHQETNDFIAKKFLLVKKLKLIPILCVGETEKEKQNGQTKQVIKEQLSCIFQKLGNSAFRNTVIAYEPIWAIGTGFSAHPKDVQLIHEFIKNYIRKHDPSSINETIVQYGGSVNHSNAKEFLKQSDINGLLIGSASLNPQEFLKIIRIACHITGE
ncbi:triose-phosphate isomerase [Buchnera aphidicola (Hyperomyzus lactucae)]|uniref:Triosephosphate isomerase n=1 Tax=Buchnera aphidicola (Hyperomyzus lactucae) TaxID=1241860 RepID=A0A4D6Y4U5_9GAMM|nr:triose-phosphate isomerase [Buchnera aphidicola]QCI21030.1 triose-phosphate isomerase [Buchnera aphidicola (Hyperomyzus lactucae)]